ncbi:MAG: ABC transporter ATP-binding protein, partial [bacterium]
FVIAMFMYELNTQLMLTQLLPFIYILLRIVPLTKIINAQKAEVLSKRPYVELVYNLLRDDDKPFIPNGHQIFSGLAREIQFRAVSFVYNGTRKPVLHEVNFSIPAGKTTAIVGESGAGKSTIANLLLRFYDPQQGGILLDGEPLPNFKLETYHRKIGVVSQDTFLFSNTVKFNIAFSVEGTPSEEQIIAAAKKAGAHDFIMELPNGYDTFVGDRGMKLSGGQRQRISIARAILRDPEILILDEATSALDTKTERRIHQAILELSHGRTVIIIAHRLSTIKNADQIVVLKHGQVAEIGHPEDLLEQGGEYYQLAQ